MTSKSIEQIVAEAVAKATAAKDAEIAALKAGQSANSYGLHVSHGKLYLYRGAGHIKQASLFGNDVANILADSSFLGKLKAALPSLAKNGKDRDDNAAQYGYVPFAQRPVKS